MGEGAEREPRRMRLRHCTHKKASRRIVPADSAASSVAFGSHQRCKAPCKVAKRPLFPHSWGRLTTCGRKFCSCDKSANHNLQQKAVGTGVLDCPKRTAPARRRPTNLLIKRFSPIFEKQNALFSDSRGRLSLRGRVLPLRHINHNLPVKKNYRGLDRWEKMWYSNSTR